MAIAVNTIMLKLYKPSSNKKIIIDEAMDNYSRAFQYLLKEAYNKIEVIEERYCSGNDRYKANDIAKWVNGSLDKNLNSFSIEPFKDSIKIDFAAVLSSYLNLKAKGKKIKYPLEAIKEKMRPIFFCRYSLKRNYSLLYNSQTDRYYAKIYLMNVKNEKRKRPSEFKGRVLKYIYKSREIFIEKGNKRSFLMFPLSFGKYQEKYLKEAIENPEIIKTARLIKRKNEYFLSINIVKDNLETHSTENYMSICRGIINAINYSIVDNEGELLIQGYNAIENNLIATNSLHRIANVLVEIAKKNSCQVIVEKLIDKGDNLSWKDSGGNRYFPIFDCKTYNEFINIINYKLVNNGLPSVIRVSGIEIFNTCPNCQKNSKKNRFSSNMLMCICCGSTMDIEKAGSLNLARKLIKYNKDKIKIKVESTTSGVKFSNKELALEYYPANPYDYKELMEEIDKNIKNFYDNINVELKKDGFKKKYSLIKKLEANKDIFELVNID